MNYNYFQIDRDRGEFLKCKVNIPNVSMMAQEDAHSSAHRGEIDSGDDGVK